MSEHEQYDAVVVGARCAGASLALRLARAGWRVRAGAASASVAS